MAPHNRDKIPFTVVVVGLDVLVQVVFATPCGAKAMTKQSNMELVNHHNNFLDKGELCPADVCLNGPDIVQIYKKFMSTF